MKICVHRVNGTSSAINDFSSVITDMLVMLIGLARITQEVKGNCETYSFTYWGHFFFL